MTVTQAPIPGVLLIEPSVFGDSRGFFLETYSRERYREAGIHPEFVQDNTSFSTRGVLRGLHFQSPRPQGKLVQVHRGEVFDVAVDIRLGSPTFGEWHGVRLSEENHAQYYIPPGLAHGFLVLSEFALVGYKCTDYYNGPGDMSLKWDDPEIGIVWPLEAEPILSAKDQAAKLLSEVERDRLAPFQPLP
jgi:dTDP-4-dehydrorhamnose 3,5-epimerase